MQRFLQKFFFLMGNDACDGWKFGFFDNDKELVHLEILRDIYELSCFC